MNKTQRRLTDANIKFLVEKKWFNYGDITRLAKKWNVNGSIISQVLSGKNWKKAVKRYGGDNFCFEKLFSDDKKQDCRTKLLEKIESLPHYSLNDKLGGERYVKKSDVLEIVGKL